LNILIKNYFNVRTFQQTTIKLIMDLTFHWLTKSPDKEHFSKGSNGGFTLLELLVVISIMMSLAGLTLVSLNGVRNSMECQQAVNMVMSTIERARLEALQNGSNAYVVLAIAQDASNSSDAIIVIGDPPISSADTEKVWYTRWLKLPKTVHFLSSEATLTGNQLPDTLSIADLPPQSNGNYIYAAFTFNSTGQVTYPAGSNLVLALQPQAKNKGANSNQLYDIISLSRYTGKVRTELSNLANLGIE
jgi:prepilin-type N-terminal cleavage/methylation domain-containing protein